MVKARAPVDNRSRDANKSSLGMGVTAVLELSIGFSWGYRKDIPIRLVKAILVH